VHVTIDAKGGMSAANEENYFGLEGASHHIIREELDHGKFGNSLTRHQLVVFPLARSFRWDEKWDPKTSCFVINSSFELEKYARDIGRGQFLVCPRITAEQAPLEPWKLTHEGVAWTQAESCSEEIRITLPEGFSVKELPDEWRSEAELSSCRIQYRSEGHDIVVCRESQIRAGFHPKQDYEALRMFIAKLRDAVNRPIVIQRITPLATTIN
jgi:hypothetical protein